ncbi:MAG: hypothetical protein GY716_13440 [bacterium]|nr:hypothetical protein [bacterium]
MRKRQFSTALLCCLWLGAALPVVLAEEPGSGHGEEHAEQHHPHHRFGVALFVGATRAHGENESTLGIEFGYNINQRWSVGGVFERAEREAHTTLILAGVGFKPYRGLRLQAAAGRKDPAGEERNVGRLGLGYEFELGKKKNWAIKPYLAEDFIEDEEDEEVFGVYVGYLF